MVGETNTAPLETAKPAATPTTPEAGAEPKPSILKKWWVWAIVIAIILGVSLGLFFLL